MLSRIFVEIESGHSGTKRRSGGTNALFVGFRFSRDVGVDLLLIGVIEGEPRINLSQG